MSRIASLSAPNIVLPLLLALLLTACGTGPTTMDDGVESVPLTQRAPDGSYTPTLDGPLRLLSVSPRGSRTTYGARPAITATFSRPMVPLGEAPTPPDSVLTVEPSLPGALQWEGTQTLVFRPSEDVPPATAFTVTLHPYLASTDGATMEDGYSWTFETVRPRLTRAEPSDGARFAPLEGALRLEFNLSVDADAAAPYLDAGTLPVDAPTNDGDSTLVLPFAETLPQDSTFTVTLAAGLPTTAGPLGLADTTTVRFHTYPPLRMEPLDQPAWRYPDDDGLFAPDEGLQLTFSTPVRVRDLREALAMDPEIHWPPGIEARDSHTSTTHTLTFPLLAETEHTLRIDGLTDTFGQTLSDVETTFTTGPLQPSLSVPTGALVVEASELRALPLRYVNVPEVRIGAERFTRDTIVPALYSYDNRHRADDDARPRVAPRRVWELEPSPNSRAVRHLLLDSLLTDGYGVVGWQLAYDRADGEARTRHGLAQYTDLGLTAKFSPHQSLVLVSTLGDAAPVAEATVEVRDADNTVLWEGTTGADGTAPVPGWTELVDTDDDSRPTLIVIATHEGDLAFTSSRYDRGISLWRFGIRTNYRPEPITRTGTLFTDRGLYRGGETVHIKGILRSRTDLDWEAVEDSLRFVVHDPRGEVVLDERLQASALGSFDTTWRAPRAAAQGTYEMRVGLASDTTLTADRSWNREGITTGSFRVDAFRRAAFTVEATAAAPSYVAGDFFEGSVMARYLFGAGLSGADASLRLRQTPGRYRPPDYDDYAFATTSGRVFSTLATADTTLDADSRVSLREPIPGNPHGRVTQLEWLGRVTDRAQQQIAGRTSVTVHPGTFYIGVKPSTGYLDMRETDELAVDLIAVDPDGRPLADESMHVALVRREWHSVREAGSDGPMNWPSEETETLSDTMT
ncbi:MAG: MG2 domain-containing protein, partial [Candidatus Brocadiia bacterium]